MGIKKEDIKEVIDLMKESPDVGEIEWKVGSKSIRISRTTQGVMQMSPAIAQKPQTVSLPAPEKEAKPSQPKAPQGHMVKSPMVGTFYLSASPEADPFVRVGQKVKVGDILCLIEAMKMFNKIKADKAGKVVDVLVKDSEAVEFDQPLFVIE
jgi:acetyl-CoA carboxylase biotin carboxyl carrier protein